MMAPSRPCGRPLDMAGLGEKSNKVSAKGQKVALEGSSTWTLSAQSRRKSPSRHGEAPTSEDGPGVSGNATAIRDQAQGQAQAQQEDPAVGTQSLHVNQAMSLLLVWMCSEFSLTHDFPRC